MLVRYRLRICGGKKQFVIGFIFSVGGKFVVEVGFHFFGTNEYTLAPQLSYHSRQLHFKS